MIAVSSLASVLFAWRLHVLFEVPLLRWLGRQSQGEFTTRDAKLLWRSS